MSELSRLCSLVKHNVATKHGSSKPLTSNELWLLELRIKSTMASIPDALWDMCKSSIIKETISRGKQCQFYFLPRASATTSRCATAQMKQKSFKNTCFIIMYEKIAKMLAKPLTDCWGLIFVPILKNLQLIATVTIIE